MSKSMNFAVGTTPTILAAPDWFNYTALPFATQTASFTLTSAMCGPNVGCVPYNSASPGTVTIPQNITTVGDFVLLGQAGTGPLSVAAGAGVTVTGSLITYGTNQVLMATQTSLNNWYVLPYSWNLPQFLGNPNAQPLLLSYGQITFINQTSTAASIDINPNIVSGTGYPLTAAGTAGAVYSKYYGNAPGDIWYGVTASGSTTIGVQTGAPTAG